MGRRAVLVVGATGTQGGAVADQLLADDGVVVHALTRDPESSAARELATAGATVVPGDLYDPASLRDAVGGVDAVFAVTDYWDDGYDGEIRQGVNIANAAASEGVDHFVYSSVAGADAAPDVPMLKSKARIEAHVERLGLPATILRPTYFMQNFELRRGDIEDGTLALPLSSGVRLPMVDATDIGRFAARTLTAPESTTGETVPLAGAAVTLDEMARIFGDALGETVEPVTVPPAVARSKVGEDYVSLFEWYNREPLSGLVEALERDHDFSPTSLSEYLVDAGWTRAALGDAPPAQRVQ